MPATLVVIAVLALPLVLLFRYSLNQYDRYDIMVEAFTLENYIAVFGDAFYRNVLFRTIQIAAISTTITVILGFPVAYFIARAPRTVEEPAHRSYRIPFAGRQSGASGRMDGGYGQPRVFQPVVAEPWIHR